MRVTVEEENADRMDLMKSLAESQKTSLPEIQAKQAELWRNRSFKGEWIETPGPTAHGSGCRRKANAASPELNRQSGFLLPICWLRSPCRIHIAIVA